MRALVYEAPETMILRDVEPPAPRADEVVVRVAYSGICGSELSGYLGQNSLRTPPLVFGHELSGWVSSVGAQVSEELGLDAGTPVTANPLVTCGHCKYCVTGRQQLCGGRQLLGAHLPGCNAELVAVPAASVLRLPHGLSLPTAAMAEPAACAVHAVEASGAGPTSTALVLGAGPIGLFILQVLKEHGVTERYVADLNTARLEVAAATGALPVSVGRGEVTQAVLDATRGAGVDVSFDAVGSPQTRRECLSSTRRGGQVLLVGLHTDETSFPVNTLIRSEVRLGGVFAYSTANFRTALDWLATGRIGLQQGVVLAPLSQGPQWYARLVEGDGDGAAKVLLQPTLI